MRVWAEFRYLAGPWLSSGINLRTAGLGIKAQEDVLIHIRFAFHEPNGSAGTFEKPQITVARHVNQALDGAPAAPVIDKDRRRNFVPIPRIVGVILEMSFDFASGNIDCDSRRSVEIVAGPLVTYPWAAIASAPVSQVGFRVVISGNPDWSSAGLPLIAFRPRLAARLSRRRDGVGSPLFLSGIRIERRNK